MANVGTEKVADCTKDETDAKNELDQSWPQFGASDKQTCVGESSIGGGQSYVELLTCLEMSSGEFLANGHQISPLDQPVGAMDQQLEGHAAQNPSLRKMPICSRGSLPVRGSTTEAA